MLFGAEMPDYFDGHEIVAQTKNFMVTCDDNSEARFRAQKVAAVCEADLASLNDLFSTNFEVGNTSDYTIWVHALTHRRYVRRCLARIIPSRTTGPNPENSAETTTIPECLVFDNLAGESAALVLWWQFNAMQHVLNHVVDCERFALVANGRRR
jgi:hypothetical protein